MVGDDELIARVQAGQLIDRPEEMSEGYRRELVHTLTMVGDTELIGAAQHYGNLLHERIPDAHVGTLLAIVQDELGHAHIAYRLLEDLGIDTAALLYDRPAKRWDFAAPETWDEVVARWKARGPVHGRLVDLVQSGVGLHRLGVV